jgi:Icc-related predicted phosphoesterase
LKIFFVSDIHGSVKCFRKLVNAGKFYGADVLIMGGDLVGKQLIPIIARGSISSAHPNPCVDPAAGQQGC